MLKAQAVGEVIRRRTHVHSYKLLLFAVIAVSMAFVIHDGFGQITFSLVVSRVCDAIGDVLFDRGCE
jgi:hypothetical protein